jgi:hypothetical protein
MSSIVAIKAFSIWAFLIGLGKAAFYILGILCFLKYLRRP